MKTVKKIILIGIIMLIVNPVFGAGVNQFHGNWKNIDTKTGGITRVNIRITGQNIVLQVWGKCSPRDCDWGRVPAYAYTSSVSGDIAANTEALSASFNNGFSEVILIMKLQSNNRLVIETFTLFKDKSGRNHYQSVSTFERG
jgi:hypothetical protein